MRHVINSEFFRLVRRPAIWIMPIILVAFIGLMYVIQFIVYSVEDTNSAAMEALQLQNIGDYGLSIGTGISSVLIAVMAAQTMGSEYSWGTIRALVPRSRRRSEIIGAKIVSILVYAVILIVVTVVASIIATLVIGLFSDVQNTFNGDVIRNLVASTGRSTLAITVYGLLALMITVLTRSTAAGIAITLALQFLEDTLFGLIGLASETISDLRRFFVADNVNSLILANSPDAADGDFGGFLGANNEPWVAAGILVIWTVFFAGISFYIFKRRDVTTG